MKMFHYSQKDPRQLATAAVVGCLKRNLGPQDFTSVTKSNLIMYSSQIQTYFPGATEQSLAFIITSLILVATYKNARQYALQCTTRQHALSLVIFKYFRDVDHSSLWEKASSGTGQNISFLGWLSLKEFPIIYTHSNLPTFTKKMPLTPYGRGVKIESSFPYGQSRCVNIAYIINRGCFRE